VHRGEFRRWLISPQGQAEGVLFEDGTIARFQARSVDALPILPQGAKLQATGETPEGGQTLFRSAIASEGRAIIPTEAAIAPSTVPAQPESQLPQLRAKGKVEAYLKSPHGRLVGFVLDDSTTVRAASPRWLQDANIHTGDVIAVDGRGTATPVGRGIWATTLTFPNGNAIALSGPALSPVTHDGEVARLLPNPHGDIGGILLRDGTYLRLPPTPPGKLVNVTAGTRVHVEGTGYPGFIETDRLRTDRDEVTMGPVSTPAPAGPPLRHVATVARVDRVLTNPEGEVETLLLSNATVVKLSPLMRDSLDVPVRKGDTIRVSGMGGQYPIGMAIDAEELTVGLRTVRPLGRRP